MAVIGYRETPYDRIVAVGWGGRFAYANFTPTADDDERILIRMTEFPDTAEPPVYGGERALGDAIDLHPWAADTGLAGALSIDVAGVTPHQQLANFRRLEERGKEGFLWGNVTSALTPTKSYTMLFRIFSGGIIRVSSIAGFRAQYTLEGGTVHFTRSEIVLLGPSNLMGIRFNKDGTIS